MNIVFQLKMRPEIPTVYGPLDYRIFRARLIEIDRQLTDSGLEHRFIQKTLESAPEGIPQNANHLSLALRTVILLNLIGESYRKLAYRIADSQLSGIYLRR